MLDAELVLLKHKIDCDFKHPVHNFETFHISKPCKKIFSETNITDLYIILDEELLKFYRISKVIKLFLQ